MSVAPCSSSTLLPRSSPPNSSQSLPLSQPAGFFGTHEDSRVLSNKDTAGRLRHLQSYLVRVVIHHLNHNVARELISDEQDDAWRSWHRGWWTSKRAVHSLHYWYGLRKLCRSAEPSAPVHSTFTNTSTRSRWLGFESWEGQARYARIHACGLVDMLGPPRSFFFLRRCVWFRYCLWWAWVLHILLLARLMTLSRIFLFILSTMYKFMDSRGHCNKCVHALVLIWVRIDGAWEEWVTVQSSDTVECTVPSLSMRMQSGTMRNLWVDSNSVVSDNVNMKAGCGQVYLVTLYVLKCLVKCETNMRRTLEKKKKTLSASSENLLSSLTEQRERIVDTHMGRSATSVVDS